MKTVGLVIEGKAAKGRPKTEKGKGQGKAPSKPAKGAKPESQGDEEAATPADGQQPEGTEAEAQVAEPPKAKGAKPEAEG